MRTFLRLLILCFTVTILSACTTTETYAPVVDATQIEKLPKNGAYRVSANETLYSIAWRYGLDYRDLAQRNHIRPPYHIETGQILYLRGTPPVKAQYSAEQPQAVVKQSVPPTITPAAESEPNAKVLYWKRPARGPIIGYYSSQNKGLNFGGHLGDPIYATAPGKVVYSGNGLRGYGNLIIIKHNSNFLSAYAHNSKVYVKEGDWVKRGQKIAEMGNTGTRRIMLHFEIRRNGKPVNPLNYLTRG